MASGKEKIVHRITVGGQPMTVPRRPGRMAMRKSRLVRRRIRNTFYTIGFILSSAAISQAGYGFFMEAPYFALKEPQIEGVSDDVRREIIGLISSHVDNQPNLLSINSTELEEQIALHPRVRDIRVTKVYPNSLKISAVEREEMAIAATAAGYFLVDNEGHVMGRLDLEDLLRIDLPLVSGLSPDAIHEGEKVDSDSLDKTLLLIQVLRQRNKKLYDQISEVQIQQEAVSPLETLVMHMKGGLDILLGDGNPVDKLPELETLLLKLESESVNPFSDLVYIDLSYDKMGFVMEKETALLVKNREYEIVQQALQEANEKYARTHAQQQQQSNSNTTQNQGAGQSGQVRRAAPARPAVPAQQQPVQAQYGYGYGNQQAAYPPGYYQQQQPRATYPQGYYQQPQQQRPQQYPQAQYPPQYQQQAPGSLYNMPRTQQR